jgi:DNA polymerase-3 subunit epsilon
MACELVPAHPARIGALGGDRLRDERADAARDRLLSVGALVVSAGHVDLAQAYEARVRQHVASARENIAVHGIGGDAQLAGQPLPKVIDGLTRFIEGAIPAAFHAPFDALVLRRHGLKLKAKWLDLAAAAPLLFPKRGRRDNPLEHWLEAFSIPPLARHDALGDAFATAQLLLVLVSEAKRQGMRSAEDLLHAARNSRWLAP